MKYIAKPKTYFKEGTVCSRLSEYGFGLYLYRGLHVIGSFDGDSQLIEFGGHKLGDELIKEYICHEDDFIVQYE